VRKRANRKNVVGIRVAEARNRRNPPLTQDALSGKLAALGVQLDRAAIAKIENGHRRIYDFEIKALAKALNVRIDWLFGGD
jgi:HTH-type transcriptional regulator, cell division transcriptional repressor